MRWLVLGTLLCTATCASPGREGTRREDAPPLDGLVALEVTPGATVLTVRGGQPASAAFTATGRFSDGRSADVTAHVSWALGDSSLGAFSSPGQFSSVDSHGGATTVNVGGGNLSAAAALTLKYVATRVSSEDGSTAPADAAQKFGGALEPGLAPTALYPFEGAIVPRNLGELEVQWRRPAATNLYEVAITSPTFELTVYTNAVLPKGGRITLTNAEWQSLAASCAGQEVAMQVRAVDTNDTSRFGQSVAVRLQVGRDTAEGGLYYWASTGGIGNQGGIFRHAFGDTTSAAQPFYTPTEAVFDNANHCVACHAISRDGTKMALTYDGGDGRGGVLQVSGKTPLVAASKNLLWNFVSFSPDNKKMVAASKGGLTVFESDSGTVVATLPTTMPATHPDWSADGKTIVFSQFPSFKEKQFNWVFFNGSIAVSRDNGGGFGAPTVLVASQNGENNFYPSISPDGNWIVFNRSKGDAYDDADAEVWVVSSDGKIGPIRLAKANGSGQLTNSWPRFSPFVQANGPNGPLLYLTFSSKRDYGIELVAQNRPQIWMAGFDPAAASAGQDPSFAPFWLPFQDIASNNHIAQWTSVVIP